MMNQAKNHTELMIAKKHLEAEIMKRNLRKSSERFKLLEELYNFHNHFSAEDFYQNLLAMNFPVSKATVYNNLELFEDIGLILRHQFGKGQAASYERALRRKQHSHLVCLKCHRIFEFCDPRIYAIQTTLEQFEATAVSSHALTLYGECQRNDCHS